MNPSDNPAPSSRGTTPTPDRLSDSVLENRFRYHRPTPEAVKQHEWVTETTLQLAKDMRDRLPPGRNLSIVLTLLEDVRMRANAAIACGN